MSMQMALAQTKAQTKVRTTEQMKAQKKAQTAATPWGPAGIVEEITVPQRAGEKRFSVVVQLLETRSGERLIRFAYTTEGSARRGPVTMRARDLERLRAALERAPVLKDALAF